MPVSAVLFDFDGTLTAQGAIDFAAMRSAVGVPDGSFILEHLDGLASSVRTDALVTVERFEREAAERSFPNDGAEGSIAALRDLGILLAIVTRNGRAAILRALENFSTVTADDFGAIVTRDDGLPPKPAPDQLLEACRQLRVMPGDAMMVGDFRLDVEAGTAAGVFTVYLDDPEDRLRGEDASVTGFDRKITSLRELPVLVRERHAADR